MTRSLGQSRVRGKQDEMAIAEVIWSDTTSLTQMAGASANEELRNLLTARLMLEYRGRALN